MLGQPLVPSAVPPATQLEQIRLLTEAYAQAETFAKSTLDSLSSQIAILANDGTILQVNESWRQFAIANALDQDSKNESIQLYDHDNYLNVCDNSIGDGSDYAAAAATGIREVISGTNKLFTMEYPCHSSSERRWFCLRVTPFQGGGKASVVVTQENITERVLAEEERQAMQETLIAAARNALIAEVLQRAMLLESPRHRFSGLDIYTLYEPALDEAAIGGDFLDAFQFDAEKIALVVGDISGKGLAAAERITEAKYVLRTLLSEHKQPEIALTRMNEFIYNSHLFETGRRELFVVLALAIVDTLTGDITLSSAGAEPWVILRNGGKADQVETFATPLGILPDSTYTEKSDTLQVGDTLLLATDGMTEARKDGVFLGIDGLAGLAENAGAQLSLDDLSRSIYGGALSYSGGHWHDDICLLLARRVR